MINLLPQQEKAEIRAGRTNRLLLRYIILFAVLMLVLFAELGVGYLSMAQTKSHADTRIADNQASSAASIKDQQRVQAFTTDLATAKQILDKQVNYSSVLLKVSSVFPPGTVVDQLVLDPATFGKPTTLSVRAVSDAAALQLKDAMNSSPYFKDPHFETIGTSAGNDVGKYPITLRLTVIFTQELLK